MFVIFNKEDKRKPIKVWLENESQVEEGCLEQANNLASLPFIFRHVALMPDTHQGYGMPIGGVIGTHDVIIPHAIGNDIGCGMAFIQTNIPADLLRDTMTGNGTLLQSIVGSIMRSIPTGFGKHKGEQQSDLLETLEEKAILENLAEDYPELYETIFPNCYYQLGTLGSGNHFLEIQEDDNGKVAIMVHSGSRNMGYNICKTFNNKAKELNEKFYSSVPKEHELAFLPLETKEGQDYIKWMNIALDFAKENREVMMFKIKEILFNQVKKHTDFTGLEMTLEINAHHNYAALENHFGKNVWVHRKGAIRAREGELGIIPGAMGSYSYIVEGLGNPESFFSCSHGAGRKIGRKKASEEISVDKVMNDLKDQGVILGKHNKEDVAEEARFAYKDIDFVIEQELDLIKPLKKLKTMGVIKG